MEQEIEEGKTIYNNKKESLIKKKNELVSAKQEISRQIQQVEE